MVDSISNKAMNFEIHLFGNKFNIKTNSDLKCFKNRK